jgi:two-component system, chemotaxis family, protein-glutamate methylesterase/glutaminase
MKPVRVMIVEDSATVRACFARAMRADARLEVIAECESAEQALAKLDRCAPDVISMDIHLPGISGLDATRRIMERRPTPIVIVSHSVNAEDLNCTIEALRAGAVSAVEKPACRNSRGPDEMMGRLCRELAVMSGVRVIRQRFNRPAAALPEPKPPLRPSCPQTSSLARRADIVGIVASTGGPRAVQCILESLGSDWRLPIVLVQHITASFQAGFVSWLMRIAPQPVQEAAHGMLLQAGCVYVAPAAKHLLVRGSRLELVAGAPAGGHRPSGTLLLHSLAESHGPRAVGVVVTGMGDDGAEGLLAIRRAGGYTITEHESTTVVNGMPQAACSLGASCASLPLESIGEALRTLAPCAEEISA